MHSANFYTSVILTADILKSILGQQNIGKIDRQASVTHSDDRTFHFVDKFQHFFQTFKAYLSQVSKFDARFFQTLEGTPFKRL